MSLEESIIQKTIARKLNHDNFQLKNHEIQALNTDGMMGEHIKIICNVQENNVSKPVEHVFFLKKKSEKFNAEISSTVFMKEVKTFSMFESINFPTLNKLIPKCYYSDNQHIILEDLTVEKYKSLTADRVATEDEVILILKTLAGMHAAGIAYEEQQTAKNPNQPPIRLNTEFPEVFVELYFNLEIDENRSYNEAIINGLKTAIKVFNLPQILKTGKRLENELLRFWDLFDPKLGVKPSTKYRNVMSHCDLWAANIFIKYDENRKPQEARIIDYQIERYLPPAFDVLDFVLLNTTREYRQNNMSKLKRIYYDFFSKYLGEYGIDPLKIYTFDEFLDSFKEIECFGVFAEVTTIPMVCNTEQTLGDIMQSEELFSLLSKDTSALFTQFTGNKYFMDRVRDCLLDMVDYFEQN